MKKLWYDFRTARRTHKVKAVLHHLFIPHESNNYRAKILHHKSLFLAICVLLCAAFVANTVHRTFPGVLGISNNITLNQLLQMTNQKRAENSVGSLVMNTALASAAQKKADDMFTKNYWAHNGPDGTTPWVFIRGAGYDYLYAGENLARGFTTTQDAIDAWMASPDHRRNMLSKNYQDVGFAVVEGKLTGEDTILIVEELGSKTLVAQIPQTSFQVTKDVQTAQAQAPAPTEAVPQQAIRPIGPLVKPSEIARPVMSSSSLSKNIVVVMLLFFIAAFILDMIIIERKKVTRFVGHNEDHIFYLAAILVFIIVIFGKGAIL